MLVDASLCDACVDAFLACECVCDVFLLGRLGFGVRIFSGFVFFPQEKSDVGRIICVRGVGL